MPTPFTPEQNARLTEAVMILTESNAHWEQTLALVEELAGEQAAREVRAVELQAQRGLVTVEQVRVVIEQAVTDGVRRRLTAQVIDGFIDEFFKDPEILKMLEAMEKEE